MGYFSNHQLPEPQDGQVSKVKRLSLGFNSPVTLPEYAAIPSYAATEVAAAGAAPSPEGLPRKTSSYWAVGNRITNTLLNTFPRTLSELALSELNGLS